MTYMKSHDTHYTRRERELMDILFAKEEASAAEVHKALASPPTYTTVRRLLTILVEKGHVTYRVEGKKYIYQPVAKRAATGQNALQKVIATFYEGSLSKAVAGLMSAKDSQLTQAEIKRLSALIKKAEEDDHE